MPRFGRHTDCWILGELEAGVRKNDLGALKLLSFTRRWEIRTRHGDSILAYEKRDSGIKFLKVNTVLDVLRSDARFQELDRRVGGPIAGVILLSDRSVSEYSPSCAEFGRT